MTPTHPRGFFGSTDSLPEGCNSTRIRLKTQRERNVASVATTCVLPRWSAPASVVHVPLPSVQEAAFLLKDPKAFGGPSPDPLVRLKEVKCGGLTHAKECVEIKTYVHARKEEAPFPARGILSIRSSIHRRRIHPSTVLCQPPCQTCARACAAWRPLPLRCGVS